MKRKRNSQLTPEDKNYISALLVEYESEIKNTIWLALGDDYSYLADEAMSDFSLAVCERLEALKKHPYPKAWLLITLKNICLNLLRGRNLDKENILFDAVTEDSEEDVALESIMYNMWVEEKKAEELLSDLSTYEMKVYQLAFVDEERVADIAKILDTSVKNVKSIIGNIKKKVKSRLKKDNIQQ